MICALVFSRAAALRAITVSASGFPSCPSGLWASIAMPRRADAAHAASLAKYGCSSNWLTAGTIPVSAMTRSIWAGWKFDTPAERSRPSVTSSAMAFQVET